MVKKKIKPAPNIIEDMERQKFLKFRDEYRLKHPFFNFVYNSFPLSLGVASGFISGLQTFLLSRESLPDNLQKILDDQLKQQDKSTVSVASEVVSDSDRLPFEPKSNK